MPPPPSAEPLESLLSAAIGWPVKVETASKHMSPPFCVREMPVRCVWPRALYI